MRNYHWFFAVGMKGGGSLDDDFITRIGNFFFSKFGIFFFP